MKNKINILNNIIIIVLLVFISLIVSILIMIINATDDEIYINYLSQNDLIDVYIKPKNNVKYISNDTIQLLDNELNKDCIKLYKLNDTDFFENYNNEKLFFNLKNDDLYLKIINKNDFDNMKVIGQYPSNENEIVINEVLAYDILNDYNKKYNEDEKITSYEEILNKVILINKNEYLKITGIKQENLEKYKSLLNENSKKEENDLYKDFEAKYRVERNVVFVDEKFFENNIEYKYNKNVRFQDEDIKVNLNISSLKEYKDIYDGVSLTTNINNLNNEDIIIDLNLVDILSNGDLKEKYNNIEWHKLTFQNNDEYYDFFKQFIVNYLRNIDLVGKELILDNKSYNIKGIYIKNYKYGNNSSLGFVNNNILDNYIKKDLVAIVEYNDLNSDDISKIYNNSSKYNIDIFTKYDNNYRNIINNKSNIKNCIIYISIIVSTFLFLLIFINYRINRKHINNLKKIKYYKFLIIEILVGIVFNYIIFYIFNNIFFEKSLSFNYISVLFVIINLAFFNYIFLLSNNIKLNF